MLAIRKWSSRLTTLTTKHIVWRGCQLASPHPQHRKEVKMDINFEGIYNNVLIASIIEEGEPYIRFTLTESVNIGLNPADFGRPVGSSRVRKYKEVDFKYVDISLNVVPQEKFAFLKTTAESLHIQTKSGAYSFIPPTNIASTDVRISYPSDGFRRWQSYKRRGKKYIKVIGIVLGFILAITQIAFNIVTVFG